MLLGDLQGEAGAEDLQVTRILGGALLLASVVHADPREDDAIRLNAEASLRYSQALAGRHLDVEVHDGTAIVEGDVRTLFQKWEALEQVARVRGVVAIEDRLEVFTDSRRDSALVDDVRRRIEDLPKVANQHLTITASAGAVKLAGKVDDGRVRFAARDAAAQIRGVKAVIDAITTDPVEDEKLKGMIEGLIGPRSLQAVPGKIEVEVEEGRVTLTGKVPRLWDRIDAEKTVLGVNGVREVVNRLEVEPRPRPDDYLQ